MSTAAATAVAATSVATAAVGAGTVAQRGLGQRPARPAWALRGLEYSEALPALIPVPTKMQPPAIPATGAE